MKAEVILIQLIYDLKFLPRQNAEPKSTRRSLTVIDIKSGTFRSKKKKKKINDLRSRPRVGRWGRLGRVAPEMIWSFFFDPTRSM